MYRRLREIMVTAGLAAVLAGAVAGDIWLYRLI
jgi:hypothetical protein